jgi:SAM-dependent methyltransferase
MTGLVDQNARVLDQFTLQAEAYAALVNKRGTPLSRPLLDIIRPIAQDRVLDVGCGSGQFAVAISSLVAQVTGVDITPAMLDQARALQTTHTATNIEWIEADCASLPVRDGAFDLVISRSALHHAAHPLATLSEMRRACASGGRIAVLDLTPAPDKAAAFDAIELLRDPSHARALPTDDLRALGAELGLAEIAVHTHTSELPIEVVLATSFPPPGMLARVRELYARDAARGTDTFGLGARFKDGQVWVSYPMTLVAWRRSPEIAQQTGA